MAGDGRHSSAHAEVVSGALVKVEEEKETQLNVFVAF